jgi:hypothetical protein
LSFSNIRTPLLPVLFVGSVFSETLLLLGDDFSVVDNDHCDDESLGQDSKSKDLQGWKDKHKQIASSNQDSSGKDESGQGRSGGRTTMGLEKLERDDENEFRKEF